MGIDISLFMVLVLKLTEEEISRHKTLIQCYFKDILTSSNVDINYYNNGVEKGIYRVRSGSEEFLAAAASKDVRRELLSEYNILGNLYRGAKEFFPRPISHYSPEDVDELGELFLMQFLPHLNLMDFDKSKFNGTGLQYTQELAYQIGKSVAIVHSKTGRYSSEPHDGNILAKVNDDNGLELKFCDAIQFRSGDIEQAVRAIISSKDERRECYSQIKSFRNGLADGLNIALGISRDEAWDKFDFLREYNDIF
jgi:hypothetical protein